MGENEGLRLHVWGGPLVWEQWELPDPAVGEVQVEVEACGVGQTVLNYVRGDNWSDPSLLPRVPGHELVGRVSAVGEGVRSLRVGARVVAYFYLACFSCAQCASGREDRCQRLAGRIGVHRDGGYARRTNLPEGNAIEIGDSLDAVAATVVPDAVATSVHVCHRRLRLEKGDQLVVIGAGGGVGAHLVQVAMAMGAEVTGLERTVEKLELVESLGATTVDSSRFDSADLGPSAGGVDAIVDLVGTVESGTWALEQLGQGGRLCVLSAVPRVALAVRPRDLVMRETGVLGSHYATREELRTAARLVAGGDVRPVVDRTVTPREVEGLHDRLRAGTLRGRGAVVWPAD